MTIRAKSNLDIIIKSDWQDIIGYKNPKTTQPEILYLKSA